MLLSLHWSQARSPWEGLKAGLLLLHMPNFCDHRAAII
jgi:hypothetical protein